MSANIREQRFCIGFHKQSALQTALAAADCITLMKTNLGLFSVDLRTENNAQWIGKDDEFPTANYKSYWDVAGAIDSDKGVSSEKAALFAAFGLGKAVLSPLTGGGFNYLCTPLDPLTDEIEMPSTTVVEAIRQGANYVIDRALVGMVLEEFGFTFNSGPGLQSAQCRSQWVGCGKNGGEANGEWKASNPSGIVIPAATTEHLLPAYSMEFTMLTNDYVTAKTVQSATFGWKNNIRLDSGFYPGSGSQDGAQIRGRMEHGDRQCTFSVVARFMKDSPEVQAMLDQTEGTMVLKVTGAQITGGSPGLFNDMTINLHRIVYQSAVIQDADGIVTVAVETLPMKHSSNGLVTIEVNTEVDEILETPGA